MSIPKSRGKTLFIDIDGTFELGEFHERVCVKNLPGVREAFNNWHSKGYRLILTTARCESTREVTEKQLRSCGLFWDVLLMGVGGGQRVLIIKSDGSLSAIGLNVPRDIGLIDINKIYQQALKGLGVKNLPEEI